MDILNWLNQNASVVNVLVLVAYAIFTLGIWIETRRSARLTEELARQSRDAFRLQVVLACLKEALPEKELPTKEGQPVLPPFSELVLLEETLGAAFPEQWKEIQAALIKGIGKWGEQAKTEG